MNNSIFINVWNYISPDYPFNLFLSERGYGKTYSSLDGILDIVNPGERYMLMRRTADEMKMLWDINGKEGLNPYAEINEKRNINLGCTRIVDKLGGIYEREFEADTGKVLYTNQIGYTAALSNFAGVRGMSMLDCTWMIYDEFIPEKHIKAIKAEGEALLQAYETINRNRELQGRPPLMFIGLANSLNIYNAIFRELGLVSIAEKMVAKGQEHYYNKKRGIALHIFNSNNEFTRLKANTALYRLTADTDFSRMALKNEFISNDFSNCGYKSLAGWRPICSIDNITLYNKGSNVYACYAPAQCVKFNSKIESDKMRFYRKIGYQLVDIYTAGKFYAEDFNAKQFILDLIFRS